MPPLKILPIFTAIVSLATSAFAEVKVLLIEGASNHDWEHRIEILESILSRDGTFELDVSVTPASVGDPAWSTWNPNFAAYDVVISGYSNSAGAADWPAAVKSSFESYVSTGGGFLAFHEANQSFVDWPAYQEMVGLGWTDGSTGTAVAINPDESLEYFSPGQGSYTGHGDRADVLVSRLGSHPIHAGLPVAWMAADLEVVRYARGPASNLTILSYATDPDPEGGQAAKQWPVEWTVNYGSGRVYSSTYGHLWVGQDEPIGMRCAAFQETFVRALKWCAGEDPGMVAPNDFPDQSVISIRPHSEGLAGFGGPQPVAPFANGILPDSSIVPTSTELLPAFPNFSWESPIDARPWPETADQMMITEMDGRFFKLTDDDTTTTRDLVLDLRDPVWYANWDAVNNQPHGGVMSCVFHPRFGKGEGKDFLYVYYLNNPNEDLVSNPAGDPNASLPFYDRVSRFTWTGTAFDPLSEVVLIQQYDTTLGHEGGGMTFGGDGYLYIAFGDEGTDRAGAAPHTQKLNDRARSGVWRIDIDESPTNLPISRQPTAAPAGYLSQTQGYRIPSDNPWITGDGSQLEEFYSLGLREPHRMSYDPVNDRFWIGDVGAGEREEVNILDGPGLNFQWRYGEGEIINSDLLAEVSPVAGVDCPPVHAYGRSVGACVIGGYVYRGTEIPSLSGKYIFGDFSTQIIYALEFDEATQETVSVEQIGLGRVGNYWEGLGSFGIDTSNELLVLQMGAGVPGQGLISRMKPEGASSGLEWEYPELLSEAGVFTELETLTPVPAMIPYEVNNPLWSAGLAKKRWVMIPNDGLANDSSERIVYSESQQWELPVGSVLVKHFERPDNGVPVETRLMVRGADGWGGVSYKWRPDGSEADRLADGLTEEMTIDGETFNYLYPSRSQCLLCHSESSGWVLGLNTRQFNREVTYPSGVTANQIESFSAAGFIPEVIKTEDLADVLTSAKPDDPTESTERKMLSYLDSNCSHCHQPGGSSRAFFDTRLTTPLTNQAVICGPVIEGLGLPAPAVVKPGSLENSVMFQRMNSIDECCAMPPVAKGRIDQNAVSELAGWILGMTTDSCSRSQSFLAGGELGMPADPTGVPGSDSWVTNTVINKDAVYVNSDTIPQSLSLERFRYHAMLTDEPLTPFVVKVNGDNDFTVLAVGTTRENHLIGENEVLFDDSGTSIVLAPGEKVALGFIDTFPDGSGGTSGELVRWSEGGALVWHGGSNVESGAGSVAVGSAPYPGESVQINQTRDYFCSLGFTVTSLEIGNSADQPGFRQVDGASSNFAINLSDTFTNTSGSTLTISVDRFRFETERMTDPLTPFVVRINGPDDVTVLAIGQSRTNYGVGFNDVPFASGTSLISVAAGETIATGFVDSFADGSGGSGIGAMSFISGGDSVYYRYHDPDHVGATLELGKAPVVPHPYGSEVTTRSYLFSVTLGFGGEEDEDADGLIDSWELAYSPSLETLSSSADSDQDGTTDFDEFQSGTDPLDRTSQLKALSIAPSATDDDVDAAFKSVPGRRYRIMLSPDLSSWIDAGDVSAAAWPAETTTVTIPNALLPAGSESRLFLKVGSLPVEE
ncbi:PQQ-dependent sugar dehydrogenase [Haloferula sp.]|uniref:PQQ-dependent sugar dehydrogenase n=1 Tax=Haloferula sp. TaxID=2497595 RepID=UPI00329EF4C5